MKFTIMVFFTKIWWGDLLLGDNFWFKSGKESGELVSWTDQMRGTLRIAIVYICEAIRACIITAAVSFDEIFLILYIFLM